MIAILAGEAMKEIDAYTAEATAIVENMIIKVNFLGYIDDARDVAEALDVNYYNAQEEADDAANIVSDAKLDAYDALYAQAKRYLTNTAYYADRDRYELGEYKDQYEAVLQMIANKEDDHLALLSGKAIETIMADPATVAAEVFEQMIKEVKSSQIPEDATDIKALLPFGALATNDWAYEFVGTYAVEYYKVANADATYKDSDGETACVYPAG